MITNLSPDVSPDLHASPTCPRQAPCLLHQSTVRKQPQIRADPRTHRDFSFPPTGYSFFFFFLALASVPAMFKVDLLYIIVMLMLPDGLESRRAHSHHVSVITGINFVQVFASGSLDSRVGRPFAFSKRAEELRRGGIRSSQEEWQINDPDKNKKKPT